MLNEVMKYLLFIGIPLIFSTIPVMCYGVKNWSNERILLFSKIQRGIIHCFMMSVWVCVFLSLAPQANFFGILFLLFLGWLVLPIKHPADYKTYQAWWADRRNWYRG